MHPNPTGWVDPLGLAKCGIVYRGGSKSNKNFTPRPKDIDGLSTFNKPILGKNQVIDTSKLTNLEAVLDNPKSGHVSIRPKDKSKMQEWINSRDCEESTHPFTKELQEDVIKVIKK